MELPGRVFSPYAVSCPLLGPSSCDGPVENKKLINGTTTTSPPVSWLFGCTVSTVLGKLFPTAIPQVLLICNI